MNSVKLDRLELDQRWLNIFWKYKYFLINNFKNFLQFLLIAYIII